MFYEALGSLIGQSGDVLSERTAGVGSSEGSARDEREARQIALLLRRTRGVWPSVFETLETEERVLREVLAEINGIFEERGLSAIHFEEEGGPLPRYRALERALDEALTRLLSHSDEAWAGAARLSLRRGLSEASEIQGRLTDEMLAIR